MTVLSESHDESSRPPKKSVSCLLPVRNGAPTEMAAISPQTSKFELSARVAPTDMIEHCSDFYWNNVAPHRDKQLRLWTLRWSPAGGSQTRPAMGAASAGLLPGDRSDKACRQVPRDHALGLISLDLAGHERRTLTIRGRTTPPTCGSSAKPLLSEPRIGLDQANGVTLPRRSTLVRS